MASTADMNQALRNKLIELQGWTLVLLLCFSCLLGGVNPQELPKAEMDALQALKRAWSTDTPRFDEEFKSWNSSRPCGDSTTRAGGWVGVRCDFNSIWPNGVTVTKLSLPQMRIVGVLPSEVSKLSNLEYIDLYYNLEIYGPIPKELVQLRNLTHLDLSGNKFSGEFPFASIINGSKLQLLDISSNQFNETLGEDAFRNLGELRSVDLSSNGFTGDFPFGSIINGSRLQLLHISFNQFNGTIRDDAFQNLGELQRLYLAENNFVGKFPFGSIINGSKIQWLLIPNNQFNGTIGGDAFQNTGELQHFDISGNKFSGEFPIGSINNGSKIQWLDISSNQFNGTIREDAFQHLGEILRLDLSSNEFTGQPNLTSLVGPILYLNLSRNKFEGHVPDTAPTFLASLGILNFSKKGFTGKTSYLCFITYVNGLEDFSQNNFIDYLPEFIGFEIDGQIHMNLSSNHFSNGGGRLTTEILSIAKWTSELYLDENDLSGSLNVTAILESNASQNLNILSLKDNMITNVLSPNTSIFSVAIGLTKVMLQGNPYCKKTSTSEHDIKTCNFYCANTCFDPKKPKNDRSILIMATSVSSAIVVLVIFLLIMGFCFVLRGKEKYIQDLQKKINEAHVNAKRFDYNALRVATKNFAPEMKLGEGGYGAVYKGILASNVVVAVKQLRLNTCASREEFVNEVLLISDLQHQNLVGLKGYCLNDKQTLLVYEYVDNCDLGKLLLGRQATGESTSQGLDLWKTRLKICQGVAKGLHYLHTFSESRIIHRDIKASNILVNENFEAKIADFGLARLIAGSVGSVIETSRCAGTFGYLAPEYVSQGQLSEKADVYSFGVLLLEIVSGMRNNHDQRMPEDEMHLASWARKLQKTKRLLDMKDPTLIVSEDEAGEVQQVLETAVLCVQNDPKKRPPMDLVVAMLAVKSYDDALPQIDEELASEESDSDMHPLFGWTASASTSLAGRPTCSPQIELSSSKNARLWRARSLQHHLQSHVGDAM